MVRRHEDVSLIAPRDDPDAAQVAAWLDAQGVAYQTVTAVDGSPLVLRVGQATVMGTVETITRCLQDMLWRDLQS
jgi:hypothetical protein